MRLVMMKIGITKILMIVGAALGVIIVFVFWQNNSIVTTNINYKNMKVPIHFNGYKIVQISDLHNKEFGDNQSKLIAATKKAQPDCIVITGDLIDSSKTNIDIAMEYIQEAVKIAPVYFVSGNHEKWSGSYLVLTNRLEQAGVINLDDNYTILEKGGESIRLLGMQDPAFIPADYMEDTRGNRFDEKLTSISKSMSTEFKILLSHRPEKMDTYVNHQIELVFSGHAHGGQFRLPFVGGIIAPDQGFFPRYTSGLYVEDQTTMIVSRGLGNSIIPIRLFNRPELVVVTLNRQ